MTVVMRRTSLPKHLTEGEADPYPFQSVYENGEGLAVVITDVRTDVPGSEACGGEGDPGNTYLAATIQAANVLEEGAIAVNDNALVEMYGQGSGLVTVPAHCLEVADPAVAGTTVGLGDEPAVFSLDPAQEVTYTAYFDQSAVGGDFEGFRISEDSGNGPGDGAWTYMLME